MKLHLESRKSTEILNNVKQKGTEIGKKTVDLGMKTAVEMQKNAKEFADKAEAAAFERRMKKYNPLFIEKFQSEDFIFPKMIMLIPIVSSP